jgi:hypothetical protein
MKRIGFISILDGVVALIVLLMFSSLIFSYLRKTPDLEEVFIYRQGYDILTVLEHKNFSSTSSVFANTPQSICVRLELYDSSLTLLSTEYKTGCGTANVNEKVIWRTFIDGQNFKMAKLAIWRK